MTESDKPLALVSAVRSTWSPRVWASAHVAVAVSGGADSMALLRCLDELHQAVDTQGLLYALHVNHQLRGAASAEDAAWLVEACRSLGIASEVLTPPESPSDADLADGVEAYARRVRYELLGQACERLGVRHLATAHTADDQAETVLLRILRGTGIRGAAGIPFTRPLTPSVSVVRPLLSCSRRDVLGYLQQVGQSYRQDETNSDLAFRRNLIRQKWLPELQASFPDAPSALRRFADQCRETQEVVDCLAEDLLALCDLKLLDGGGFSLLTAPLAEAAEPLAREALRLAWRSAGIGEQGMTRQRWCELSSLSRCSSGGSLNLPGGVRAGIETDRLVLRPGVG